MDINTKNIHTLGADEVLKLLQSSREGLSQEEAGERLREYGKNAVKRKANLSWVVILWHQFNNALVWILLVAGFLSFLLGEQRDTTIILIIVGLNAAIGFFQEFKAEKTLEKIRNLVTDSAVVLREGKNTNIDSRLLTIGDVILLSAGDRVPADAYLLDAHDLYTNEFIFTGESKPGKKILGPIVDENISLADKDNMLFMGTSVTRGDARAVVVGIGMDTELGKIANMVNEVPEDETPLQKQIRILGKDVTILALFIGTLVLIAGAYYDLTWYDRFLFALALAVSVVPEGLPAAISVALSLGMKRLLKHNVLAKKLNSVETLASVSVICTDKTGTITKNEIMVTDIVAGSHNFSLGGDGYCPHGAITEYGKILDKEYIDKWEILFRTAALCNDSQIQQKDGKYEVVGDPTEGAMLVAALKYAKGKTEKYGNGREKITALPFSSERMRMSVIYAEKKSGAVNSYVKGSPDILLERCTHIYDPSGIREITDTDKERIKRQNNEMSSHALRVLACAFRELTSIDKNQYESEAEQNLVWIGMMGMIDPPRKDVAVAVKQCQQSGIKVIMITGDYEITARAIARNIGLVIGDHGLIINGRTLDGMSDRELFESVKNNDVVFARIAPAQKLRIATVLKDNDVVIAMTGDGVNDAPALKKADIGIAMGIIGTDVSKEASDMILLDDNFASIVRVVKEGRTIYQNLKKFVHYVFTSNASEFITVIIGVLLQIPAPIVAVQILAIDLGTDVFPSFSLSMEPSEPTVMKRKPFDSNEKVLTAKGAWRIIQIGLIMASGAIVAFILNLKRGGWDFGNKIETDSLLYIQATTVAYAVLSVSQMANLLQSRSESLSVFALGFFRNRYLIFSIFISIGMLLSFMYVPLFQKYLHMRPIGWQDWIAVAVVTIVVFLYEEIRKSGQSDANTHITPPFRKGRLGGN